MPSRREATVVERRPAVGHVAIVEVQCPHGSHRHTVGLAATSSAELWCSYGGGHYRVTLPDPEEPTVTDTDHTETTEPQTSCGHPWCLAHRCLRPDDDYTDDDRG